MAVTVTEQTYSSVKKIKFTWATTGSTGGTTTYNYDGAVLRVLNYGLATTGGTIVISDEDGYDILMGKGTFTSGESFLGTTDVRSPISAIAESPLTCTVSSTGGSGVCVVYVR